MPPKKTTPPLDPEAVHLNFASQEAMLLKVINAEAKNEIAKPVLSLATELKNESKARRAQAATSGTVIKISDSSSSDSSSGGAPSTTDNSVVNVDVTMLEPTLAKGRGKGRAAIRASAPPSIPTTRKMDYVSIPGMDTGSPAFLRSMVLNSKRARAERDLPPINTVDDRAISNKFISLVLAKTHGAITNFTECAQEEDLLRRAISETRLEMVSVIHKLHIFANYWEILNKEYAALKASLATFCTEKVPKAPEVIPLDPAIEL
ncbi:hypothetical protein EST38_g12513 [Candolleomyces aberdarensis]|uniref:Uncharacterized protein n=1 Tax=Candolleomyces aberdarensis TaxID=2316362 RepID=A0A4Q2D4G4_9AGAR|nr:hypothetical protein EST38_g12513 [Candolleomyces aberdarensis]